MGILPFFVFGGKGLWLNQGTGFFGGNGP